MKSKVSEGLIGVARDTRGVWDEFRTDHAMIERLKVSPQEMEALSTCSLLGTLTCKEDMLFILRQIREASGPASPEALAAQIQSPSSAETCAPEPTADPRRMALAAGPSLLDRRLEPSALSGMIQSWSIHQAGVMFWMLVGLGAMIAIIASGMLGWMHHFQAQMPIGAQVAEAATGTTAPHASVGTMVMFEAMVVGIVAIALFIRERQGRRRFRKRRA